MSLFINIVSICFSKCFCVKTVPYNYFNKKKYDGDKEDVQRMSMILEEEYENKSDYDDKKYEENTNEKVKSYRVYLQEEFSSKQKIKRKDKSSSSLRIRCHSY